MTHYGLEELPDRDPTPPEGDEVSRLRDQVNRLEAEKTGEARSALLTRAKRAETALKLAYLYHHCGDESIGSSELSDELCNTLCEIMGDASFQAWSAEIATRLNP